MPGKHVNYEAVAKAVKAKLTKTPKTLKQLAEECGHPKPHVAKAAASLAAQAAAVETYIRGGRHGTLRYAKP